MEQKMEAAEVEKLRLVVNRSGDITSDVEILNRADARRLFEQILKDFCLTHGMKYSSAKDDKGKLISKCVDDGVFVSKKYGFSVFMSRIAA